MSYKVIKSFTDLQDNNFLYNEGDTFPRKGFNVLPSRINELSTSENRRGEPLIVEIADEPKSKRVSRKTEKN